MAPEETQTGMDPGTDTDIDMDTETQRHRDTLKQTPRPLEGHLTPPKETQLLLKGNVHRHR